MPNLNPRAKDKTGVAIIEDVEIAMAVRIVAHGGRYYLSVRPRDVEFWDLQVGDEVLLKITKVKRTRGSTFKEGAGL
jgi:hypothetical protein